MTQTALQSRSLLIIDDEELARHLSREYLAMHPTIKIVGECDNGIAAVEAINTLKPDLILLDIHMPKLSGLEVLEITGRHSGVIFTTAYDEYALKAFNLHAVDYLLKPYSQQRFNDAINKAQKLLIADDQPSEAIPHLIADQTKKLERIIIKDRDKIHIVAVDQVDYIEAQDDYISIRCGEKSYLKTQHLSDIEAQLDSATFVRIHRSYLLNMHALKGLEKISKDSHCAVLRDGKQLPISRAGYERIKLVLK